MRARGFPGLAATGADGATATDSVAACICVGVHRRYAIPTLPSNKPRNGSLYTLCRPYRLPIKNGGSAAQPYGNHEKVNKSKGPNLGPGL